MASSNTSVSSVPPAPSTAKVYSVGSVKAATPDVVKAVSEIPADVGQMAQMILNDIGGQELISISRSDIVNGQNIVYQPISDMKEIHKTYNSNNIIYLSETSENIFNSFPIKLSSKIPDSLGNNVSYVDNKILIQLKDIQRDELVEIQVVSSGVLLDGTIYLGE